MLPLVVNDLTVRFCRWKDKGHKVICQCLSKEEVKKNNVIKMFQTYSNENRYKYDICLLCTIQEENGQCNKNCIRGLRV